jgi:hypothetical protein
VGPTNGWKNLERTDEFAFRNFDYAGFAGFFRAAVDFIEIAELRLWISSADLSDVLVVD